MPDPRKRVLKMDPEAMWKAAIELENSVFFPDGKSFEYPTEFDTQLNTAQREKILAFCRMHGGKCVVGHVNLYSHNRNKPVMREVQEGDMVYNLLGRVEALNGHCVAPRIMKELVRRALQHDTVFRRFGDVHQSERTKW